MIIEEIAILKTEEPDFKRSHSSLKLHLTTEELGVISEALDFLKNSLRQKIVIDQVTRMHATIINHYKSKRPLATLQKP